MKTPIILFVFISLTVGGALPLGAQEGPDLIEAVMYQDMETVRSLVQNGVDVDYQDAQNDTTALMLACNYGLTEIAAYLVNAGANVNIRNKQGYTALIAAAGRSEDLVKMLIDHGADVHAKTAEGTTAFTASILGALSGRVSTHVAEILLEAGADVDESATSGKTQGYTCLMMAVENGRDDLVRFLIDNGADPNLRAKDGRTALSLARDGGYTETAAFLTEMGAVE
jgi:ankyrin repeat protein